MSNLTHFSLFSGIGGVDLAAEMAGFESIGQCEFADYPTKVLEKHWPDVPRWRDVRDVTADSVRAKGVANITVLSGGFPCQPFSVAGKQKGKDDDRYLWPEMLRVISELKPTWVIGENVAGIVNMALEQVCLDLETEGYEVQSFIIPASSINAYHQRKRVFIVAYSKRNKQWRKESCNGKARRMGRFFERVAWNRDWEGALREFRRMDDGLSYRVDRIDTLRNAVVPQQVYPILQAIADIERSKHNDRI